MILRRPNLLKWDNYLEQSIDYLETSKDAAPSDRLLCAFVRVQHISEEVGVEFSMNDPSAQISINDQKVKYQINEFERELKHWRRERVEDLTSPSLELFYHVCNLYLHEIVMHVNHNIDDFRVPVTEESLKGSLKRDEKLTPTQINAITQCQNSAIGILETYCSIDWETVRSLPMFLYFVRIVYAFVILLKLYFAATDPESEIGKLIDPNRLRIGEFLDKVAEQIKPISTSETYRPFAKVLFILGKLREWYHKHKDGIASYVANSQEALRSRNTNNNPAPQPQYGAPRANSGLQLLSSVAASSPNPSSTRPPPSASVTPYNSNMPTPRQQQTWPSSHSWQHPGPYGYSTATSAGLAAASTTLPLDPALMNANTDPNQLQFPPGLMDSLYSGWGSGFEESMDMTMNSWVDDLGRNLDYADGVWPAIQVEEAQRM